MTDGNRQVIFGNELKDGYSKIDEYARLIFRDAEYPDKYYFSLDDKKLSKHILMLGGPGSGKTNVFKLILRQLRRNQNNQDIYIIFDTKGDYFDEFKMPGDMVVGNSKKYRSISARWNIFDEVLADGEDSFNYEINAREIAASLFSDRASTAQPFFVNAASDIFAQTIIYFIRRALEDSASGYVSKLNNKALVEFLLTTDVKNLVEIFKYYDDMRGIESYLGDGTSNQALGVLAELKNMLYQLFIGVFKQDMADFSIRNSVRSKGGKAIFIEYDLMTGETLTPIYRMLVDMALKEALGRSDNEKGNVYLILDELKLLPKLKHMDDALNFGRSMGVKVVAGIQSINQLYDIYGENKGKVLVGGFSTVFAFHTSDYNSREYISQLFGRNVVEYKYKRLTGSVDPKEREGFTVESWDQTCLESGDAIIGLADVEEPFRFCFELYR